MRNSMYQRDCCRQQQSQFSMVSNRNGHGKESDRYNLHAPVVTGSDMHQASGDNNKAQDGCQVSKVFQDPWFVKEDVTTTDHIQSTIHAEKCQATGDHSSPTGLLYLMLVLESQQIQVFARKRLAPFGQPITRPINPQRFTNPLNGGVIFLFRPL